MIETRVLTGAALEAALEDVARLRIAVFRDWPYLYDGSLDYEATMAHELAHHWFGNLVTCDRAEEMYINEGFAEYLSYLFLEDVYGRERYMEEVRSNHRAMVQRAPTPSGI